MGRVAGGDSKPPSRSGEASFFFLVQCCSVSPRHRGFCVLLEEAGVVGISFAGVNCTSALPRTTAGRTGGESSQSWGHAWLCKVHSRFSEALRFTGRASSPPPPIAGLPMMTPNMGAGPSCPPPPPKKGP